MPLSIVILNVMMMLSCVVSLSMSLKLYRQTKRLRQLTEQIRKMDRIYTRMAEELHNMAESTMLHDLEGVQIFFGKLQKLHQEFVSLGSKDAKR